MIFLGFEIIGLIFIYYGFKQFIRESNMNSNIGESHSYYYYQPPPLYEDINEEDNDIDIPVEPPPKYE